MRRATSVPGSDGIAFDTPVTAFATTDPYRPQQWSLDALGVLRGQHALFVPANNGREPLYIYLVALSIALFGPTTLALRLPAAVVGTLTTLPAWLLGRAWFGRTVGLLAAFLWAMTLWPVHLGRIGLRAGLPPHVKREVHYL